MQADLLRLSRINFSDAFEALVHLKVVRAYIESVLRYGLPASYFCAVVKVRVCSLLSRVALTASCTAGTEASDQVHPANLTAAQRRVADLTQDDQEERSRSRRRHGAHGRVRDRARGRVLPVCHL